MYACMFDGHILIRFHIFVCIPTTIESCFKLIIACCLMTSEGQSQSEPLRSPRTAASTKTSSCCSSPGGFIFVAAGNSTVRKKLLKVSYRPKVSMP